MLRTSSKKKTGTFVCLFAISNKENEERDQEDIGASNAFIASLFNILHLTSFVLLLLEALASMQISFFYTELLDNCVSDKLL